jgi:AbrB family looped-hinge helix DNA binding protein
MGLPEYELALFRVQFDESGVNSRQESHQALIAAIHRKFTMPLMTYFLYDGLPLLKYKARCTMAATTTTAVLSSKGQIVIPAELRQEMELAAGTRFAVKRKGRTITLQPVDESMLRELRGMLRGSNASALREVEHRKDKW